MGVRDLGKVSYSKFKFALSGPYQDYKRSDGSNLKLVQYLSKSIEEEKNCTNYPQNISLY